MTREDSSVHPLEPIINSGTRALPTAISIPYICPNPCAALFQTISCTINNNESSNYQQAAQTNTLYKMLYESELEEKTCNSTNAIIPMSVDDTDVTVGTIYDKAAKIGADLGVDVSVGNNGVNIAAFQKLFSKRMIWALKNQYNFDKYNTNKLNFQLPIPLFYTNDLIYVGSNGKINMTFNVDPNWYKNLILIAGSNTCGIPAIRGPPAFAAGSDYVLTTSSSVFGKCSINVAITDMKIYLCRAHVSTIPRGLSHTYRLKQFSTFYAPLSAGTTNNFTFTFK